MTIKPAIVVSAYNRPFSLARLLQSLATAIYNIDDIQLIISVDKSENEDVIDIAKSFDWKFGKKKIIQHSNHLGLKQHILFCGDLTYEYNAIILLEDDLLVSSYFYEYAIQASEFYKDNSRVAGISLYNYQVAESCFYPFQAIDDGSDVYFMQVASSWGQLWRKDHWMNFKNWFAGNPDLVQNIVLPDYLFLWGEHSWKKHFIHYLITENKYFVFPRLSLTTNFEEEGTNSSTKNTFHVPIQLSSKKYQFQNLDQSKSIYDAWFEILPDSLNHFNKELEKFNYTVDLYGNKDVSKSVVNYILTSKKSENDILSFSSELFPLEANIVSNLKGRGIRLCEVKNNKFKQEKLHLRNYLEELNVRTELTISIIIPIIDLNCNDLKMTLNSIKKNGYSFLELILITPIKSKTELESAIRDYDINANIVYIETKQLDEMINVGFENSKNEIIGYINQGDTFNNNALNHVNNIFKSYLHVNWICGISEEIEDKYKYDRLNVFEYRIAPIEIYKRVKTNNLNYSMDGHFFRKNCLTETLFNSLTVKKMFLYFINHYQLTVVVRCLVNYKEHLNLKDFTIDEREELIRKFKPALSVSIIKFKIFNSLLKFRFLGHSSNRWYYTSNFNFPDVLRFDFANKTFYLSKH